MVEQLALLIKLFISIENRNYVKILTHKKNARDANGKVTKNADTSSTDLPCYADLFPESWLDFCRESAVESVGSPVSYLVDLYRFTQEIELMVVGTPSR